MAWNDQLFEGATQESEPITEELQRLRRRVAVYGMAFSTLSGAALVGPSAWLILQIAFALDALRDRLGPEPPSLVEFAAHRPDLLVVAAGVVVLGALSAAAGTWLVVCLLGPRRRPPRRVLLTLIGLPLFMDATGAVMLFLSGGSLLMVFAGALIVAVSLWLIPVQLILLVYGQLTLALSHVGERQVFVDTSELPDAAVEFFNETEPSVVANGLEWIGDIAYKPARDKCRRVWANRSRTVFASAFWQQLGDTPMRAVSVYSATDDGSYLETTNFSSKLMVLAEECETRMQFIPDADVPGLLKAHWQMLREWMNQSGSMVLTFEDDEQEQLCVYGRAWLSGKLNSTQRRSVLVDFVWLSDPNLAAPLPPLPGRRWQPADESLDELSHEPVRRLSILQF